MNTLKSLLAASVAAIAMTACATSDDQVLSDAQTVGVNDNDRFSNRGNSTDMADLDPKFKVGCDDGDRFEAYGCDDLDSDGDGLDRDVYRDDAERQAFYRQYSYTPATMVMAGSSDSVVELLAASPNHTRLVNAVMAADLADALSGDGPFTIFAPTDAAFDNADLTGLSDDADLKMLLMNHVIDGRYLAADVLEVIPASGSYSVPTLGDRNIDVYRSGDGFKLLGAQSILVPVMTADMIGSNGVVHVIDTVLVPDYDSPNTNR